IGTVQRRRIFRHAFHGARGIRRGVRAVARQNAKCRICLGSERLHRVVAGEPERESIHLPNGRARLVSRHRDPANPTRTGSLRRKRRRLGSPHRSKVMLGKLTWNAIPWDHPIPLVAGSVVFSIVIAVVAWVVLAGHLPYLFREWITSVDHKRIGVMYTLLALVMLVRGFIDAIMMRSQQALAFRAAGYLPPEHYNQIFSAHGTIMIFFAAMPLVIGLMNFAVPL